MAVGVLPKDAIKKAIKKAIKEVLKVE